VHQGTNQLDYSEDGKGNRDLFLADQNTVLFYAEDENWEEFYTSLLRRIYPDLELNEVFCLGGKGKIRKRVKEKAPDGKQRVFLVDKDFDDLLGQLIEGPEVAYLGRYSIENYFIASEIVCRFLVAQKKGTRLKRAAREFGDGGLDKFIKWYDEVCRYFVVAQRYKLKVSTTKSDLSEFCEIESVTRRENWWAKFCSDFKKYIVQKASHLDDPAKLKIELTNAYSVATGCEGISDKSVYCNYPGKHLLRLIVTKMETVGGLSKKDDWMWRYMMFAIHELSQSVVDEIRLRIGKASEALR